MKDVNPIPGRRFPSSKAMLLAFVALVGQAPVALCSEVSLPSQSAAPGSSILLPAVFVSQASSVSGLQFDVQYDSSAMNVLGTVGDATRNSGKSLYYADLAPNKRRFVVVGLNQSLIADGALINLFVNLNPNASNGLYSLALSNILGTDQYGQSAPTTGTGGTVAVQGTIDQALRLQPMGVLNGASLLPGPVAAGEVVTLIGSGIGPASEMQPGPSPSNTVLAGTSVLLDGIPAPLLYAGPSQINTVIPYGVSGKVTTQLEVAQDGHVIAGLPLPVAASVPAIFTLDSSGVGPGVILNEDSTVNSPSNPAARGSAAVLFATGAGQTDPSGADGQVAGNILPKPVLRVFVEVGGFSAEMLYAGAAPAMIAGVLRVDFRIPPNVAPGYAMPVVLTVGTARSQPGVTVAVR